MFWKAHWRDITSLALAPDLSTIISGDVDGSVFQWDIETGEKLRIIRVPAARKGYGLGKIAFSPDGSQLGLSWNYSTQEGQLEVYDSKTWTLKYTIFCREIDDFAWKPTGEHLVIADVGVQIIDAASGKSIPTPRIGHTYSTNCIAYTPDGTKLISGGDFYDPSYALWDAVTFEELSEIYYTDDESIDISEPFEVLYISKEKTVVNDNGCVIEWDFEGGHLRYLFTYPRTNNEHTWAAINTNGRLLAYAVVHGEEDIPNWHEPSIYKDEFWARARKPTGATVRVHDLITGETLHSFEGYKDYVTSLLFSPDSKRLFTGDWEGYIRIWEL